MAKGLGVRCFRYCTRRLAGQAFSIIKYKFQDIVPNSLGKDLDSLRTGLFTSLDLAIVAYLSNALAECLNILMRFFNQLINASVFDLGGSRKLGKSSRGVGNLIHLLL